MIVSPVSSLLYRCYFSCAVELHDNFYRVKCATDSCHDKWYQQHEPAYLVQLIHGLAACLVVAPVYLALSNHWLYLGIRGEMEEKNQKIEKIIEMQANTYRFVKTVPISMNYDRLMKMAHGHGHRALWFYGQVLVALTLTMIAAKNFSNSLSHS